MKSKFHSILFPALAAGFSITNVHAAVGLANGSFETTGTLYLAALGDLYEASGWTNLSPTTNFQASSALAFYDGNPFGTTNDEFTSAPGTATGSRYLRLVADGGNVGVLAQSLGSMTTGETYTISADVFGGPGAPPLAPPTYGATISLVNEVSAVPSMTYASQTVSGVANTAFTAGAFNFSYTATPSDNGNPLVLLLTAPALGGGQASRGGLDNIQLNVLAPATQWALNGNGNWNTPANWSPATVPNAPSAGATLDSFGGTITGPVIATLDVPVTLGTLRFNHSFAYTIAGSNALTLDNGGSGAAVNVLSGAHTILAPVTMAESLTATVVSNSSLDLAGGLSGSAVPLLKNGRGILQLSGINTYTGATTVGAGTLSIASTGVLSTAGNVNSTGGGVLDISGTLTMAADTYFAVGNGIAGTRGTTILNSGASVNLGGNAVLIGGNRPGGAGSGIGTLTINGGTLTVAAASGTGGGADNGNIYLNPYGTAGTSILNLNGGVLNTARPIADGGGANSVINLNGGTLQAGADLSILLGFGTVNVRNGGAIIDTQNFNVTIGKVLSHSNIGGDNAMDGGLTKNGIGTLTLTAANTYTGNTSVEAGTLILNQAFLADTADVELTTGATLQLDFTGADTIDQLFIDGLPKATGTWGRLGHSTAQNTTGLITGNGLLQVGAGYASWANGFAGFTNTAADLDFENDGLASGIEWVVGGNPTLNDAASVTPTFDNTTDPNNFLFTFRRRDTAATDPKTTIIVQYGSDLIGWTTAQDGVSGVSIDDTIDLGGGFHQVTVAIPRALAPSGKLFARLNVTVAP